MFIDDYLLLCAIIKLLHSEDCLTLESLSTPNFDKDKWFGSQRENQEPRESSDAVVTVENVQTLPQPNVHLVPLLQHQHSPVRSVHVFMVAVVIVGGHYLLAVFAQMYTHAVDTIRESREAEVVHAFHRSRELSCRKKAVKSN